MESCSFCGRRSRWSVKGISVLEGGDQRTLNSCGIHLHSAADVLTPVGMTTSIHRFVHNNQDVAGATETFECGRCRDQGGGYIGNVESGYDWEDCECQGPPSVDNASDDD